MIKLELTFDFYLITSYLFRIANLNKNLFICKYTILFYSKKYFC